METLYESQVHGSCPPEPRPTHKTKPKEPDQVSTPVTTSLTDHELILPDSIQTIIDAYTRQHPDDFVTQAVIKIVEIIIKRTQQSPLLAQETFKLFIVENTRELTKKILQRFVEFSKQQSLENIENYYEKIAEAYPDFKGDKKKSYIEYKRKIQSKYSTELENTSDLKTIFDYVLLNLLGQILIPFGSTIFVTGKELDYEINFSRTRSNGTKHPLLVPVLLIAHDVVNGKKSEQYDLAYKMFPYEDRKADLIIEVLKKVAKMFGVKRSKLGVVR